MKRCPICHARLSDVDVALPQDETDVRMESGCENTDISSPISVDSTPLNVLCPRCGSDLTLLYKIEEKARDWLNRALYHLTQNQKQQALDCIQHSIILSDSLLARSLYVFITYRVSA